MENFQKYDETQYTKSLQKYFLSWIALTYTQLLREGQTECNFAESGGRGAWHYENTNTKNVLQWDEWGGFLFYFLGIKINSGR